MQDKMRKRRKLEEKKDKESRENKMATIKKAS